MGSNLSQQARDRIYTCRKNGKTELNLSDCALDLFPKPILKFKPLKKLVLARNLLQELPPELKRFVQLEDLDVSTNELQALPLELGELQNLTSLNISHNTITQFAITLPPKLRHLNISSNSIASIGVELNCPLEELLYQRNKITIFPTQVLNLRSLKVLNLCGNRLTYMPDEIDQMLSLESVDISENSFTSLPPSLFRLVNLTNLNIGKNMLGTLPQELEALTQLTHLNAYSCNLRELTIDFAHLTNLVELTLRENSLQGIGAVSGVSFDRLTNLRTLDLAHNSLVSVPRKLWLNNNSLRTVPGEFHFFPPSIDILLNSNPLDYPFSQLVSEGVPTLLDKIAPFIKAYGPKCIVIEDISTVPAGKPLSAKLVATDYVGKPRITGGDEFVGRMVSFDNPSLRVDVYVKNDKNSPGHYDVFFSCFQAGRYELSLTHEDMHVKGSPFTVEAVL